MLLTDRRSLLLGMTGALMASGGLARAAGHGSVTSLLNDYVSAGRLTGAVFGVQRLGAAPEYVSVGVLGYDTKEPMRPDSIFRILSMSKPVTGVATMRLIQDGKLKLDQPISDILPEFREQRVFVSATSTDTRPAAAAITIRNLLTHTAGLSNAINGNRLAKVYIENGIKPGRFPTLERLPGAPRVRDLETMVRTLAPLPLDFDPGTRWQYSIGPDVLGAIIQRVTKMPLHQYLQQTIFGPLGMPDTDFMVPSSKVGRLTDLKVWQDGALQDFDLRTHSGYLDTRDIESGSGGLVSTAPDYLKFMSMWLNDGRSGSAQVMRPETAKLARSNLLPSGVIYGKGNGYGAGVQVILPQAADPTQEPAGSWGWSGAAGTQSWMDPVNRICATLMVQYMPSNRFPLGSEIRVATYRDLRTA